MKVNFWVLIAVLGSGVGMGWMLRNSPAEPAAEAEAVKAKTGRPAVAEAPARVSRDGEEKAPAKTERPERESRGRALAAGNELPPEAKEAMENMKRQMEESRTRKIDERVAVLKNRLKLTPDQEAKVRALFEEPSKSGASGTVSVNGMDLGPIVTSSRQGLGKEDEEKIAALLTADQQNEFTAFQDEQKENRLEIAKNGEMSQLQRQLTLTPEQKDRAFDALGDVLAKEAEQGGDRFSREGQDAAKQARLDALRPILTPEQMAIYESSRPGPSFELGAGAGAEVISIGVPAISIGSKKETP